MCVSFLYFTSTIHKYKLIPEFWNYDYRSRDTIILHFQKCLQMYNNLFYNLFLIGKYKYLKNWPIFRTLQKFLRGLILVISYITNFDKNLRKNVFFSISFQSLGARRQKLTLKTHFTTLNSSTRMTIDLYIFFFLFLQSYDRHRTSPFSSLCPNPCVSREPELIRHFEISIYDTRLRD